MGQKACKCVQAESADDHRSDVYKLAENVPQSPPAASSTDGDVSDNRDDGRETNIKRLWRKLCRKGLRSAQGEREEQNTPAADTQDHSPQQAAAEGNENTHDDKKKKKKRRFWRKNDRGAESEREDVTDRRTEGKSYQQYVYMFTVTYSYLHSTT